ncbi:hypothetical protein BCV70DRAFT_180106 [Testicularia cyperi]|uniref:DUF202 domain-containing protein n=1 Tax=Testicularia cyperi TaxID=1882483 RepID=A0A317XJZ1_9BASI|nr:hypothetical protein BCV70DRAFT_180106 [Testicularia cyperi]
MSNPNKTLQRINTGLTDASGQGPRSSGSRLSLHIPNAYPRGLSPRSPSGSAASSRQVSRAGSPTRGTAADAESSRATRSTAFAAVKGNEPSTDSESEDRAVFHPPRRTSTFRRDGSLLIVSQTEGAIAEHPAGSDAVGQGHGEPVLVPSESLHPVVVPFRKVVSFFSTRHTSASSARDFLARERNFFLWIRLSTLLAVLSASLVLQLKLPNSPSTASRDDPHHRHDQPRKRHPYEPVGTFDELPLASRAFAGIFLALSLLALMTGLVDYLGAERELEKEQVDFDETEGSFQNDGHTKHFVHAVMLVIGAGIVAAALWLIVS